MTDGTDIETNANEFLDDQSYDSDTNEPIKEILMSPVPLLYQLQP